MESKFVTLLKSRKFWATIIALFFVVVMAIDPAFPLDEEQTIGFVSIVAAYVISVGVEGGWREFDDVKSKLLGLLRSRKFWAAIVGFVFTVAQAIWPEFPIGPEEAVEVAALIVTYILGTAIEDKAIHSGTLFAAEIESTEPVQEK